MDDANLPSLLAMPYYGYANATDEIYLRTRKAILSDTNPWWSNVSQTPLFAVWISAGFLPRNLLCRDRARQRPGSAARMSASGISGRWH